MRAGADSPTMSTVAGALEEAMEVPIVGLIAFPAPGSTRRRAPEPSSPATVASG